MNLNGFKKINAKSIIMFVFNVLSSDLELRLNVRFWGIFVVNISGLAGQKFQ